MADPYLRPAANVFCVRDVDPQGLAATERALVASGEFSSVWRPTDRWVAAVAPLPQSPPDGELRDRGFAFAEGRDRLQRGKGLEWLERVAELAGSCADRLHELPGDFTFFHWDRTGDLIAVRSCGGLAPVYSRPGRERSAVGTRLDYFARFLPDRLEPDPLVCASALNLNRLIDDRSLIRGVTQLPRGSHMRVGRSGQVQTGTYWDPRPQGAPAPLPDQDHAQTLREILLAALRRDLDPDGRNTLWLSGGADSTSLAALAGGTLGLGLSAWSLVPPYEPALSEELGFIEPIVARYVSGSARRSAYSLQADRLMAAEPASPLVHLADQGIYELGGRRPVEDVRVAVGGEFADELCGQMERMGSWASLTPAASLWMRRDSLPFGRRDYLRWGKHRLMNLLGRPPTLGPSRLPEWAAPDLQAEYGEWRQAQRSAASREPTRLIDLPGLVAADYWTNVFWEGLTPLGIRRSTPFWSREAIELAFATHPWELLGPGPKRLLRGALDGLVPERNLNRTAKLWTPPPPGAGIDLARHLPFQGSIPASSAGLVRDEWIPAPPRRDVEEPNLLIRAIGTAEHLASRDVPSRGAA